jgi:hypothetical protein
MAMARAVPWFPVLCALVWAAALAGFLPHFLEFVIGCLVFLLVWRAGHASYARLFLLAAAAGALAGIVVPGTLRIVLIAFSAASLFIAASFRNRTLAGGTFMGALAALALVSFSCTFITRTVPIGGALIWMPFGLVVGAGAGSWSTLVPQSNKRIAALVIGIVAGEGFFLISFVPLPLLFAFCTVWLLGAYLWFAADWLSCTDRTPLAITRLVIVPVVFVGILAVLFAVR